MKLAELSEIRRGIKVDPRNLVNAKPVSGKYYEYWEAETFTGKSMKFVAEREIRKHSNRIILNYGDYFVYKQNNQFKVGRYQNLSGQAIASNSLIVISSNYSIIGEFLGYEKNKKYFCSEIENNLSLYRADEVEAISNIEILTDDILELENSNTSEQFGIRKSLDSTDLPINITQKPIPLDKLIKRIEHGELILDTEFQRKSGLWKLETKSRFIESLIVSVPIPAFYFDGADDDKWLIIDGLQRLNTIIEYLNDSFELITIDFLSNLKGKKFSDLERAYQRSLEENLLLACIIQKGTSHFVKYRIYENINSSRLAHNFEGIEGLKNELK